MFAVATSDFYYDNIPSLVSKYLWTILHKKSVVVALKKINRIKSKD